jgi:putative membrane protein
VGAFILFFVPGLRMTRGGGAWLTRGLVTPRTFHDYLLVLAAVSLAGATALLLLGPLSRAALMVLGKVDYRRISVGAFSVVVVLVLAMTGWAGLLIAAVATGIGLIPVLFNSRRMNCLGVILLPVACNMSGVGAEIAQFLGLT